MAQLCVKKMNYLRIRSHNEMRKNANDVLPKKLNKKRKIRENIVMTKLSNRDEA